MTSLALELLLPLKFAICNTSAAVGSGLVVLMALTTLSFLITTPEAWISGPGSSVHGFPFLALPGLLVIKDSIMLGAAYLMADSAREYLRRSH